MEEKRQHIRTTVSASVKLMHPSFGSLKVKTRDMSHGGLFIMTGSELDLPIGTEISVQALDMFEEAPIVKAKIVRIESQGIALQFTTEE